MTRSSSINVGVSRPAVQRSFSGLGTPSTISAYNIGRNSTIGGSGVDFSASGARGGYPVEAGDRSNSSIHSRPSPSSIPIQQRSLSGGNPSSTSQEAGAGNNIAGMSLRSPGMAPHFTHYTTASPVATPGEVSIDDPMNAAATAFSRQQQQQQQRRAMTASPGVYALESIAGNAAGLKVKNAGAGAGAAGGWQGNSYGKGGAPERSATAAAPPPRRSDTLGATPASQPPSTGPITEASSPAGSRGSSRAGTGGTNINAPQRAATIDVHADAASASAHNARSSGQIASTGASHYGTATRHHTNAYHPHHPGYDQLNAPFRSMTLAGVEHQGGMAGFQSPPTYPLAMSPPPMNPSSGRDGHGAHPSISYGYHPAEPFTLGSPHLMASQSPEPFVPYPLAAHPLGSVDGHSYDSQHRGGAAVLGSPAPTHGGGRALYSPVAGMPGGYAPAPPQQYVPAHMHGHYHHHPAGGFNPHGSPHHSTPQTPQFGPVPMPAGAAAGGVGMISLAQAGAATAAAQRSGSAGPGAGSSGKGRAGAGASAAGAQAAQSPSSTAYMLPQASMSPVMMGHHPMGMSPGSPLVAVPTIDKKGAVIYSNPLSPNLAQGNAGRPGTATGALDFGSSLQGGASSGQFSSTASSSGRNQQGSSAGARGAPGYDNGSAYGGIGSNQQHWAATGYGGAAGGGNGSAARGASHRRGMSSYSSSGGFGGLNPFGAAGAALGAPLGSVVGGNGGVGPAGIGARGWGMQAMSPVRGQVSLVHNDPMGMYGLGNPAYAMGLSMGLAPGYGQGPIPIAQATVPGGPRPSQPARSAMLEEFRSRHAKHRRYELEDIKGHIVEFSGDQHGSRFIQEKLDSAPAEDVTSVFEELLPNAIELMTDVFGNYVIQKVFQYGSPDERKTMVKTMQGQILSLSLGTYGCRVVQKALEVLELPEQILIIDELRNYILQCVKDQNANHVIQKIIETTDPQAVDAIPQAFRGQVATLAAHCYSCRVLQRIFEHCFESQKRPLLEELLVVSQSLMQDQYGNYVVQWVLQQGEAADKADIVTKTKGNILNLSRHKFASNVVEEIIRAASPSDRYDLIEEILTPISATVAAAEGVLPPNAGPAGSDGATSGASTTASSTAAPLPTPVLLMMKDQYANYVLQRFLEIAEGDQFVRLAVMIQPQLANMRRFSTGMSKHLTAIERILGERGPALGVNVATTGNGSTSTGTPTATTTTTAP